MKLGKSSTGHAAVNGTCSTLVPMVHISFLRALISHRTKKCTRGPPGDHSLVSWIWQGEGSEFTRRKMLSLRAGCETRHCLSPGDTWSWAKREHQIRKVQGQRYLQVKWVHAGLALLWALPGQPVPRCRKPSLLVVGGWEARGGRVNHFSKENSLHNW